MNRLERSLKLLEKIERKLKVDLGVKTVSENRLTDNGCFQEWPVYGNTVYFPAFARARVLDEIIAHEAFHCFLSDKKIPSEIKKHFTKRKSLNGFWGWIKYYQTGTRCASEERHIGFVSGYARTCTEEDLAETFSAYVNNGFKVRGTVTFDGDEINLDADSQLRRKFQAMKKLFDEYEFL